MERVQKKALSELTGSALMDSGIESEFRDAGGIWDAVPHVKKTGMQSSSFGQD